MAELQTETIELPLEGSRAMTNLSLGVNLAAVRYTMDGAIAGLYPAGVIGGFFNFATNQREFQDLLGTPVTAPGQSIGMTRDMLTSLTFGPELVVNGDFATDTVWGKGSGWTISGGAANKAAGVAGLLGQAITLTAGQTYRVKFDVTLSDGVITPRFTGGPVVSGTAIFASGSYTQYLTAAAGNNLLVFGADSTFAGSIDNVSLQGVLGVVATQGSASLRGRWASWPVTGRRNLLTYSDDFTNAFWVKVNVTVGPNSEVAPDGTLSADKVVSTAASGLVQRVYFLRSDGTSVQTFSIRLKYAGCQYVSLGMSNTGSSNATFDLLNGTLSYSPASGGMSATITALGNGWYQCTYTGVFSGSQPGLKLASNSGPDALNDTSYVGDGVSGVLVWGAQFELGSTATAYQRVVTTDDITQSGVRNAGMWRPDLVDDALTFNLPTAVDGELILMGRDGSWREPRPASAGTAVTIGGTGAGTLATPGILRATGPLVAMGFRAGTLTADEWLRLKRRWQSEGARGELILGPELVVNGGFESASGWGLEAGWSVSGGIATFQTTGAGASIVKSVATVPGVSYIQTVDVLSITGTIHPVTFAILPLGVGPVFATMPQKASLVWTATSSSTVIGLRGSAVAGSAGTFDNISVRALTPEW